MEYILGVKSGEAELNIMIKQASDVIEWYEGMQNLVPTWYIVSLDHL